MSKVFFYVEYTLVWAHGVLDNGVYVLDQFVVIIGKCHCTLVWCLLQLAPSMKEQNF